MFTARNRGVKHGNQKIWFKKWVLERLTYRYLVKDSGYSKSTLERIFNQYLRRPPTFQIKRNSEANIVMDATYFKRELCLMLYYDYDLKYCQMYRFGRKEIFTEIQEDLLHLQSLGIKVNSITSDGNSAIIKAIRNVFPVVIHPTMYSAHTERVKHMAS